MVLFSLKRDSIFDMYSNYTKPAAIKNPGEPRLILISSVVTSEGKEGQKNLQTEVGKLILMGRQGFKSLEKYCEIFWPQ